MLKTLSRLTVFSALATHLTQYVIGGYEFGHVSSITLYIISIMLLYLFMQPILSLIGMPDRGAGYLFMSFLLTAILSYVLTLFIPMFAFRETTISELIILGIVLPSKSLSVMWSMIFSSLLLSVLMLFFNWMTDLDRR